MFFGNSKKPPKELPKDDGRHPSQDDTCRFPDDQKLREFGFTIHSRPNGRQPKWSYGGAVYNHDEAMDFVEDLEDALE